MTSSVTSSPRLAGRQCRNTASALRLRQKFLVHLVAREMRPPLFLLVLLAHAGPHVGVDGLRAR